MCGEVSGHRCYVTYTVDDDGVHVVCSNCSFDWVSDEVARVANEHERPFDGS